MNNCSEYDSEEGACSCCDPGFYVNDSGDSCLNSVKGEGVQNCCLYSTLGVCVACDSGYTLKAEDECVETTMLDNCVYMKEKLCTHCERGYIEIKGKC